MARQWREVSSEAAKSHPLYGVKNWLAVFAFGVLLVPLRELGAVNSAAHSAGMTLPDFLNQSDSFGTYVKLVLAAELVMASVILWLLFTKHPRFRTVTSLVWLSFWPLLAVLALSTQAPGSVGALALGLVPWALSCAVWVTYLQRSQRVRVTFERSVLVVESTSIRPKAAGTPTAALLGAQFPSTISASAHGAPTVSPRRPVAAVVSPHEDCWSVALGEFEGVSRRTGLWARAFAESDGNEAIAKANYLRYRAEELQREQAVLLEQDRLKAELAARAAALAHLSVERRTYAELPKGICPNCDGVIPRNSKACPKCAAEFGPGSNCRITAIDEKGQVDALRAVFLSGKELTVDDVICLAEASARDRSLATLSDHSCGETLLHWAAKLGLGQEASALIANGASAVAGNRKEQMPFALAQDLALRGALKTTARSRKT